MQIEIGQVYENKTSRFLVPCLRAYGDDFVIKLNPTLRVAVGIHDYASDDLITDRTIYMLFDTFHNPKAFALELIALLYVVHSLLRSINKK